jgi:hypothetical protein
MGALEDKSDILDCDSDDRDESRDFKAPPSLSLLGFLGRGRVRTAYKASRGSKSGFTAPPSLSSI